MSEKPKINIDRDTDQDLIDAATYPFPLGSDTQDRLANGTATMAEIAYQDIRDADEIQMLGEPDSPRDVSSINPDELARFMGVLRDVKDSSDVDNSQMPFSESSSWKMLKGDDPSDVISIVEDINKVHDLLNKTKPQLPSSE